MKTEQWTKAKIPGCSVGVGKCRIFAREAVSMVVPSSAHESTASNETGS
ncbi:hypothetical protein SEA_RICKROSS_10 [Streptomyces phage RickRoss]|nr:hypothetical protein SEA_RICKROSS_10 [Streptomyces phage RickRoss]